MNAQRIGRMRALAENVVDRRAPTPYDVRSIEQLLDEEFPDDEEMQDFGSDLSRYAAGGGEHLLGEADVVTTCLGILRRLRELGS